MLIVISPAKTLDFDSVVPTRKFTRPQFLAESAVLNETLRKLSPQKLASLMSISEDLAELNFTRNQNWSVPFTLRNARQALFAFKGDVYLGLDSGSFSTNDLDYAQQHLRILSGLYGALRPLDLIQPYRLEMGTSLKTGDSKNLYDFWNDKVATAINKALRAQKDRMLINLASQEYFSVLKPAKLHAELITPVFKDYKNGEYKVISFFAKKARGRMAAWIIRNRIADRDTLAGFAEDGYQFNAAMSDATEMTYTRKPA